MSVSLGPTPTCAEVEVDRGPLFGALGGWQLLPLPSQLCPLPGASLGAVALREHCGFSPHLFSYLGQAHPARRHQQRGRGPSAHIHTCWLQAVRLGLGGTHVLLPAGC